MFNMFINFEDFNEDTILIENIFLDPNNPRFSDEKTILIKESDITDPIVHGETSRRIKNYGISELIGSIKNVGFINIDRIVIRPISGQEGKYVVVEGNRRLAALKNILEAFEKKELPDFPKDMIDNIKEIDVLIYIGDDLEISWAVQGLRHISGVRDWKPFQQSNLLNKMVSEQGVTPLDAANSLGIGFRKTSRLLKAYKGYKLAEKDVDYGPYIKPNHFAYFNEVVFRRVALQEWLEWNDEEEVFTNVKNLSTFLSWFVKTEEDDDEVVLKITRAQDLRDIVVKSIVEAPDLFRKFTIDETMTVDNLKNELIKRDRTDEEEWHEKITNFADDMEDLPTIKMVSKKAEFLSLLTRLRDLVNEHIELLS